MAISVSDVYLAVENRVRMIQGENDIANGIIHKYALHHPAVARMLLREYRSRGIFKTRVGLNFMDSLERVIKNDKKDVVHTIFTAFLLIILLFAFPWALMTIQLWA